MSRIALQYGIVTHFRDVDDLCLQWQVEAKSEELPPYETLGLGSLGRLADDLALIGSRADGSHEILYGGAAIEAWLGVSPRGVSLAALERNYADALGDALEQARLRRTPAATIARCIRDGLVTTSEVVAFPLSSRWGGDLFLLFARERVSKYNLVDAVYRATHDGLVTLAAIYGPGNVVVDVQIISLNDSASRMLGGAESDLRWRRLGEVAPDWRTNGAFSRLSTIFLTMAHDEFEVEREGADGRKIHLRVAASPMGDLIGVTLTDITLLKAREASFRLLFDDNPMPMWVHDPRTLRFLAVNDAAVAHYGIPRERFLASSLLDVYAEEEWSAVTRGRESPSNGRAADRLWSNRTADGRVIKVLNYARELTFDGRRAILLAIVDVTEQREAEARVAHLAHHDALTGLANRVLFRMGLMDGLARLRGPDENLSVLYLDLDGFKNVNDAFGHPIGDKLLVAVAERLRRAAPAGDVVARVGGDEFAVVQLGAGREEADRLAAAFVAAASQPYEIEGQQVNIGASVGVSVAPDDADDADNLLKNADIALYRAKADGRGVHRFFEPQMAATIHQRRTLESDLRQALAAGEFDLHYQPLNDMGTGEIVAAEALLRWRHPLRGFVPPGEFIQLAEETGLITPIGDWVLREATREAASWPRPIGVCVNLSPEQFRSRGLVQTVVSALAASGLPASRLELEITESALLAENHATLSALRQLRDIGVRISMDDFGTGYSSLSYLRSFPFDKIKIDRSFVRELPENNECGAIVRAVVGIGQCLGVVTVAEGVETPEQLARLREEGCTQIQGFLFGRPVPADEFRLRFAEPREAARLTA
jgi:diguanylate cyclase (GGDEF)-like protein/PAS domain S-box-containing protein